MNKNESFANGVTTSSSGLTTSSSGLTTSSISTTEPSVNQVDILNQHINNEVERKFTQLSTQNITDSIKNLGIIAKRIQEDGNFTFPSNLNVTDNLNVSNNLSVSNNLNVSNNLSINGNLNLPSNNKILPEGCILMWGQNEIPDGWVLCDGSAYLRKEFLEEKSDELPKIINNEQARQLEQVTLRKYLVTPNLNGRFVLGSGSPELFNNHSNDGGDVPNGYFEGTSYAVGWTGGERRHTLTVGEIPNHQHYLPKDRGKANFPRRNDYHAHRSITFHGRTGDEGHLLEDGGEKRWMPCDGCNGEEHNNMPPYYVLTYIMKVY